MKEIDSNRDDILLLNKEENIKGSILENKKTSDTENVDKYVKAFSPKDSEIQSLIQKFNALPCCLNNFLEKIMKTQQGSFQLLEIRRRNITIKLRAHNTYKIDYFAICEWCLENCCAVNFDKVIDIDMAETSSKICSCGAENHEPNYYIFKKNFIINTNAQKEVDEIIDLCKDYTIIEKQKIFKEKMMNFFKGKNNDKILQIICNMLKISEFKNTFYNLDYNDDIHEKILSCLKESKHYLSYDSIMNDYILYYFFL